MKNWRDKEALSVPELAQIFGISRCLAYELVKTGEIPSIRLGTRRIVVPTRAVSEILNGTENREETING